jgi:hypothetical protein
MRYQHAATRSSATSARLSSSGRWDELNCASTKPAAGHYAHDRVGLLKFLIALHLRARLAIPLVWVFNILGFLDFANAGLSMALPLMQDPAAVGPLGWVLLTFHLPLLMVATSPRSSCC